MPITATARRAPPTSGIASWPLPPSTPHRRLDHELAPPPCACSTAVPPLTCWPGWPAAAPHLDQYQPMKGRRLHERLSVPREHPHVPRRLCRAGVPPRRRRLRSASAGSWLGTAGVAAGRQLRREAGHLGVCLALDPEGVPLLLGGAEARQADRIVRC